MFLKNRVIQVTIPKTGGTAGTPVEVDRDALLYMNAMLLTNAHHLAVGFVAVYGACKLINTASQIAVKLTPTR